MIDNTYRWVNLSSINRNIVECKDVNTMPIIHSAQPRINRNIVECKVHPMQCDPAFSGY